jgi:hypothetical protein
VRRPSSSVDSTARQGRGEENTADDYSSDRRRAAGLVTLTPNAFALCSRSYSVSGCLSVGGKVVTQGSSDRDVGDPVQEGARTATR